MDNTIIFRDIKPQEFSFLDEMLYEAIFIPEGQARPPFEIIKQPELHRYSKDFGRPGDICLVAELKGNLIGAIWTRLFTEAEKGYGYVNSNIPELSMAVYKEFRHRGIGKLLVKQMFERLILQGYKQVSLSVDKQNYAYDFYKRLGFRIADSTHDSVTMLKDLTIMQ